MPYKDPDKNREYQREWARKEKPKEKRRQYKRNLRTQVLELLGNKCVYCGCNIPEALEINHIQGGGNKESKELKNNGKCQTGFHLDIIKGRRKIDDLELTCRVCNSVHYLKLKNIGDFKVTWTPRS